MKIGLSFNRKRVFIKMNKDELITIVIRYDDLIKRCGKYADKRWIKTYRKLLTAFYKMPPFDI